MGRFKFEESFYPQTNGEISGSLTQNWTQQALECYSIGGDCSQCSIANGSYSFICQMPKVVDALVELYGIPDKAVVLRNRQY